MGPDAIDQLRYAAQNVGGRRRRRRNEGRRPNEGDSTRGPAGGAADAVAMSRRAVVADGTDSSSEVVTAEAIPTENSYSTATAAKKAAIGISSADVISASVTAALTDGLNQYIRENIGPGSKMPVLCASLPQQQEQHQEQDLVLEPKGMTWGLIPSYSKNKTLGAVNHFQLFNKRVESLQGYWKQISETKRCVVFISGFYEWKTIGGKKQPHYVYSKLDKPLQVAGIYDACDVNGQKMESFAVLTSPSSNKLNSLHDRQPVLLTDEQLDRWLDLSLSPEEVAYFVQELESNCTDASSGGGMAVMNNSLTYIPVSSKVTNVSYQGEDCTKECKLGTDLKCFFKSVPSPVKQVLAQRQQEQEQEQQGEKRLKTKRSQEREQEQQHKDSSATTSAQAKLNASNASNLPVAVGDASGVRLDFAARKRKSPFDSGFCSGRSRENTSLSSVSSQSPQKLQKFQPTAVPPSAESVSASDASSRPSQGGSSEAKSKDGAVVEVIYILDDDDDDDDVE